MQLQTLLDFINTLEKDGIYYTMTSIREDAIMVEVTKLGQGAIRERWEVEFFASGKIEAEMFLSHGVFSGENAIKRILGQHSASA